MEKIIKVALESKFGITLDVDTLMEIVTETPNKTVAVEMLLGVYKTPEIPTTSNEGKLTFISYDKWTDTVKYSYMKKDTKGAYFHESIKKESINENNFHDLKGTSGPNTRWLEIPIGEEKYRESSMSLEKWMKQH